VKPAARWVLPCYALFLTLAVSAPLLAPGYLLLRDAVSTPRSYLSDAALGLTQAAPRALPQDFAIAVVTAVVDGGLLVKGLLIAGLFLAGLGAARLAAGLLPETGRPGQLVATTMAVWNPYVAERLLQGHWSLLVGYGCLPWVVAAVVRLRTQEPRRSDWAAVAFWIALAGLTPTGLLLAAIAALVCVSVPGAGVARLRCAAWISGFAVLAATPWLVAPALSNALPSSPGLAPFAARAEPGLGTLGSLAGLGGIWNAEAVPHSRTTAFALLATVLLLTVVACGVPALLRRPQAEPLLILAAVAVLVPAALATASGQTLLRTLVDAAPGLGVLRDGQKWVALAMPGYALAGAGAVVLLRRWVRPPVAALLCSAALIAVLPDLTWGVWGALRPAEYPAGWNAVAAAVNSSPEPQTVAVLPADVMRQFAWAGPAPVLDPFPRWVRADVLSTGDLAVAGEPVLGEGNRAREIQQMLLAGAEPAALTKAGVGWVVVEKDTPGTTGAALGTLEKATATYDDGDIGLYRLGGTSMPAPHRDRFIMMVAHLMWAGLLVGSGAWLVAGAVKSRR
jgi:hypothetical protein